METNIIMLSEKDRNLFGVIIRQETKTGFLSLTDLQEAYTHARVLHGWSDKDVSNIINSDQNTERIYYLLKEQDLLGCDKTTFPWFYENVKNNGMTKTLKMYNAYRTTGRGENKQVMCNPYIWVLIAMELNPMLYARVVIWLTDKLIINRIEAGNFYKTLASALYKIPNTDYPDIAIELNKKIFGKHETGIRNKASKEQLENLTRLEDNIAFAINEGYITNNNDVLSAIKKAKEVK